MIAAHDAGVMPWVVVAAYGAAVVLAVLAARRAGRRGAGRSAGRERLFWILAALGLALLGINKELDLQTQLTAFGRQLARDGGWYAGRREVQRLFIVFGGLAALGVGAWLVWLVRGMRGPVWAGLAGLFLLGVFVMLRAASFHHVDVLLGVRVLGTKLHVWFELAGVAVMIAAAGWAIAPVRAGPHREPGYRR